MSTPVKVIVPSNLGSEFDLGVIENGKIRLKLDGTTLERSAGGVLSAKSQSIESLLSAGHNIAQIKNASGNVIGNLKETVIQVLDAINTATITKEDGSQSSITKVGSVGLTIDPVAKTLKSVVNGVESSAIDISALYADTNLIFDSYNNYVLTFHTEAGTPVTINLEDLIPVSTADSGTIALKGNGTSSNPLSADIKISEAGGNILDIDAQGLVAKVRLSESDSVLLTGDGKYSPVSAEVKLSANADNAIVLQSDGLYVPTPTPVSVSSQDNSISVVGTTDFDLSVNIDSTTAGNLLQKSSNGLVATISKGNTDTIEILGNGAINGRSGPDNTLRANVRIKNAPSSNILKATADGLIAEIVGTSSSTTDVSGGGTQANPLQVDVKINQDPTNLLQDNGGLWVGPDTIAALATIEVQDAFGTPIYMAFPVPA